jgi:hypothetical protein
MLGLDAVGLACGDRSFEPPRERLHRRAIVKVLESLAGG